MLKKKRYECIGIVMLPDSNHNEIFIGIDIKHLPTNAMNIKAWILRLIGTDAAQVVPIDMIAVIVGCIVGGLAYPFFTDDALTIPHSTVKVKTANLRKISIVQDMPPNAWATSCLRLSILIMAGETPSATASTPSR